MANQILQFFGSYDFFGKAIPGALLLFGLSSLLPASLMTEFLPSNGTKLVSIAAFLAILLILGMMIGQAVHTLADNSEKVFRWGIQKFKYPVGVLQVAIFPRTSFGPDKVTYETLKRDEPGDQERVKLPIEYFIELWNGSVDWCARRVWGIYDAFVSHRQLFAKSIRWNYSAEQDYRWKKHTKDHLFEPFSVAFHEVFDEDIRQLNQDQASLMYPHVMERLSNEDGAQHRKMQSIYSFCRSMWVVFLILTILYLFEPSLPPLATGETRIVEFLTEPYFRFTPYLTGFTTILFMDAAGTYKMHFVEYVIAGFATQEGFEAVTPGTDQATLLN